MPIKVLLLPNGTGDGKHPVPIASIQYIQSNLKQCIVVTAKGSYTMRTSLRSFKDSLPPSQFVRIHKSYIVSVRLISFVGKSELTIAGQSLPIGRRERAGSLSRFHKYK